MPKAAVALSAAKYPKELPAGVQTIQCARTVGMAGPKDDAGKATRVTESGVAVSFMVPEADNAEGITNFIALLSDVGPGEDYGVKFASAALRAAVVNGMGAQLTPVNHAQSLSFLAPLVNVRTLDPAAIAGARHEAFAREHGRRPKGDELTIIYAGLSL